MVFSFKQRLRQLGVTRLPRVEFKAVLAKGGQLYKSEFLNQATKASGGQTTSPYPEELTMTMMTQPLLEDKAGLGGQLQALEQLVEMARANESDGLRGGTRAVSRGVATGSSAAGLLFRAMR